MLWQKCYEGNNYKKKKKKKNRTEPTDGKI